MGAEVGVRKISDDGEETRGFIESSYSKVTWAIFCLMLVFDALGLWKLLELAGFL